jgi:hypothetical protein
MDLVKFGMTAGPGSLVVKASVTVATESNLSAFRLIQHNSHSLQTHYPS